MWGWPPHCLQVLEYRVAHLGQQRIDLGLTSLHARYVQPVVFPIQMIEPQLRDLAFAQAINRKQHA